MHDMLVKMMFYMETELTHQGGMVLGFKSDMGGISTPIACLHSSYYVRWIVKIYI